MQRKLAHLQMVQAIVDRMAQNSFRLKGWSVVLVSALFALAAKDSSPVFVWLAYFPAIAFWILDAYFLWQEKLFRAFYDHIRDKEETDIDFSMDTSVVRSQVKPWSDVVVAGTLLVFHGVVVLSILAVALLTACWMRGG